MFFYEFATEKTITTKVPKLQNTRVPIRKNSKNIFFANSVHIKLARPVFYGKLVRITPPWGPA